MSKNEELDAPGAAVGATGFAGAVEEFMSKQKGVFLYCYNCEKAVMHIAETPLILSCPDCEEEMKEIGVIEHG